MNRKRIARSSRVSGTSTSSRTRSRATTLASVLSIFPSAFHSGPATGSPSAGPLLPLTGSPIATPTDQGVEGSPHTPMCQFLPDSTFGTRWFKGNGQKHDAGSLKRKPERFLEQVADPVQEPGAIGAVEDPVVAGERHRHHIADRDLAVSDDRLLGDGAYREDPGLRGVDDGGEVRDSEHPEVRDRER